MPNYGGWAWHGDPTDVALLTMAYKLGWRKEDTEELHPQVNDIPFEPERQFAEQHDVVARARELAGRDCLNVDLPTGATVADLKQTLGEQTPALRPLVPQLLVAIGADYATDEIVIPEGSEVACFPPVSGG